MATQVPERAAYRIEATIAPLTPATLALVAPRGKKPATSADAWLIEGSDHEESADAEEPSDEDFGPAAPPAKSEAVAGDAGAETKQWLAIPDPANGTGEARGTRGNPQEVIESQREEIAQLRRRVEELESELAGATKGASWRPEPKPQMPTEPEAQAEPKAPKRRRVGRRNDKLDLNSATFEELRGLGLSVTQSARVIAYRDVRGGYQSLDELDEIPGLSKETRAELRDQLQL
jgi:DNA uptake protein ComE-like DNA-binding protein